MDLSLYGQSRDAEGRHRATHPGLGPRVGARVASPRCPTLRPSPLNVPQQAVTEQTPSPGPWRAAGRRPAPVSGAAGMRRRSASTMRRRSDRHAQRHPWLLRSIRPTRAAERKSSASRVRCCATFRAAPKTSAYGAEMPAFEIAVVELNDVLVRSRFAIPKRFDFDVRAAHAEDVEHAEVDLQRVTLAWRHVDADRFVPLEVRLPAVDRRVRGMKHLVELPQPLEPVGRSVGTRNADRRCHGCLRISEDAD